MFLEETIITHAISLSSRKFFSTKEAAEEYRKNHIKLFSFNDIWNCSANKSTDGEFLVISKVDLQRKIDERIALLK
jgi:hypothetical protein